MKLQNATGREGKFEACIPGNQGKREFPLTPDKNWSNAKSPLIRKFDALCQHHLYDHRVWCYHPSHPWWDSILKQRAYKLKLKYYIWRRLTINILGGKLMTILMIVTLIPFFLHCLCTSASNINTIIDRFSPSTSQQDRLLVNLSELWASQTTMVTLKIWQQKNMTSMQSCARKPFGK